MKKVIILGAGVTGLSAGWKLAEGGRQVKLIEAFPYIGGMASTFRHNEYLLDYGPHKIFTILDSVMEEIRVLFRDRPLLKIKKKSRIRLGSKYLNYPLGVADVFSGLGIIAGIRCAASYAVSLLVKHRRKPNEEESYEDWVVDRYGRAIYNLVLGPYAEKIWGDPRKLSKELAESRIASPNLMEMLKQVILGKGKKSKVINADVFYYPRGGAAELCEMMAGRIAENKGEICLNTAVQSLEIHPSGQIKKITYMNGITEDLAPGDMVISTIPLFSLISLLTPALDETSRSACRQLKTRKLILLFVAINKDRVIDDNWLFFPEGHYQFNRIFEQKAFNPDMCPKDRTVICVEITCDEHSPLWRASDEDVFSTVEPQLKEVGLLTGEVIESFTRRIESAYPVYAKGYRSHLDTVMTALDKIANLYSVGRQGGFSYTGMADSMDIGFSTAQYIAAHDLKQDDWRGFRERFYHYVVID